MKIKYIVRTQSAPCYPIWPFILTLLISCLPIPLSCFTLFQIYLSLSHSSNSHSLSFTTLYLPSLRCFCTPIENANCPLTSDWFYWPAAQPVSWWLTRSPPAALNATDNKETGFLPCGNRHAHARTRMHTHNNPTSSAKQNLSPSHKCWVSSS